MSWLDSKMLFHMAVTGEKIFQAAEDDLKLRGPVSHIMHTPWCAYFLISWGKHSACTLAAFPFPLLTYYEIATTKFTKDGSDCCSSPVMKSLQYRLWAYCWQTATYQLVCMIQMYAQSSGGNVKGLIYLLQERMHLRGFRN